MDNAERRHLFRALRRAGWTIRLGGAGHYKVCDATGQLVMTMPATPSDYRSRLNAIADLRRAGFAWPRSKRRSRHARNVRRQKSGDPPFGPQPRPDPSR